MAAGWADFHRLFGARSITDDRKKIAERARDERRTDRDRRMAERGQRIRALIQDETWWADVQGMFFDTFDLYLEQVIAGTVNPDALKALEDFYARFDVGLTLAEGAAQRMAAKQRQAVEIARTERADGRHGASPASTAVGGPATRGFAADAGG